MITRTQRRLVLTAAVAAVVIAGNASDGAYFSQSWGWMALAFLMPTTVFLILDRTAAPGRLRIAFASLFAAYGAWVASSTAWSISTPASAREVERVLVYVALALAVAFLLRRGDGAAVLGGALVGVTVVSSYGLATRLFPDRFDTVDDPFNAYRLAEPLGYWNAFGLLTALGVVLALGVVAHARRGWPALAAGAVLPVLVTALYFTFSRGSWLALFFGLAAAAALDPRRLTFLWAIAAVAPASLLSVAASSRQEALTTENASAVAAAREGHRVALVVALLVPCSALLGWLAYSVSRHVRIASGPRRWAAAVLLASVVAAAVVAVVTAGGPAAAIDELRERFEAPPAAGASLNDRLFSASGNGREETIAAAWDLGTQHPVVGTGAGTFEMEWYERRPSLQVVRDAHSLYAEVFNELGLVGLTLLGVVLVVPLLGAVRARRSRYVAPACGAYLAWVAAAGLDWHWEMVGLTTTALLAGAVGLVSAERRVRGPMLRGTRLALVGLTGTLSVLAVWSLVGNQALFAGREALERKEWNDAREDARRARSLLPWSHEPDLVLGDAAAGLGDRQGALDAYRHAVEKDPRNWVAWLRLAQVSRGPERADAYGRVRELNPREEVLPGE